MDPIVGDGGCEILQVCNLLEKHETYYLVITKLNDIALKLEVPADTCQRIKTGLNLNTTSYEALNEILTSWRAKYSDKARLSVFLKVLDHCGLSDAAGELRGNFACGLVLPQYECPPTGTCEFLNSQHKLLVISTLDKNVTATKLKDTMSCIHTNDNLEFVKKLQLVTATDKKLYSFECNDNFNLDDVFEFIRPAVKYKAVVITDEKLNDIKETLPKPEGVMFIEDTFEWAHLSPSFQFVVAEKVIKISGKRMTLREFGKKIRRKKRRYEKPSGQDLLDIINDKEPNLDKCTIPRLVSYYIPRRISPRSLLNPISLFKKADGQDKFMISGIDPFELSQYAESETTDTSANQRRIQEPKAAKYIILDMESDFEEISKNYTSPSHLIRHDKGKFSFVRSSGQIKTIQKTLDSKNVQPEHSEDRFVDFLTNKDKSKNHVVISDTPGMGKTQLLSGLANRLISKGEIVIFGVIPRVLELLKPKLEKGQEIKLAILDILSNLGEQSQSVQLYLRLALNTGSDHINVMLDGLDEIDSGDLSLAEAVLKAISTLQSVRMWVSTRPHYLETAETWLQVLGHNIQQFNYEDQLNCLVGFWQKNNHRNIDVKGLLKLRLLGFAKTCLDTLQICMRSKDRQFAGIPLQCMLLGAVFEREARNYANPDILDSEVVPPSIDICSVTDLYKRLIEMKFETYFERFPSSKYSKEQLANAHIFLSIQILFPKWLDKAKKLIGPNFELVRSQDMLNIGLVEKFYSEGKIDFIHRTIAEYFAANFVVNVANERAENDPGFKLTDEVLKCRICGFSIGLDFSEVPLRYLDKLHISSRKFKYELVVYFIDNIIQPTFALRNINLNVEMLQSCIISNFVNLFNHLSKSNQFEECLQKSINSDLVISSVMYSDLSIVQRICELDTNTSSIILPNLNKYTKVRIPLPNITVLHLAVRFNDYTVVKYLVNSQGFLGLLTNNRIKGLFYFCVADSLQSNGSMIREKTRTLRLLHRLNPQSLQSNEYLSKPLLASRVHVALLCELITLGADIFVTDKCARGILLRAAEYLNSKDYHKLVSHIPVVAMSILLRQKRLLRKIFELPRFELDPETYLIFEKAGANFTGKCGTSLLESAIRGGKGVATFDQLVSHGATWQPTNQQDWTLLHNALRWKIFPAFQYFAAKFTDDECLRQQIFDAQGWSDLHDAKFGLLGIDLNAKDLHGNTIMHYMCLDEDIEVMKLLAIQNRRMAISVVKKMRKNRYSGKLLKNDLILFEREIISKWILDGFDLSLFGGRNCVVQ